MGLLRSGSSSEEVELVRIETDHFVLVIKGRPFHERYEGLQQYRKFHQDEDMHFTVRGAGVQSVALFDVDEGRLRVRPSYRPIFFENGVYQIVITCRTERKLTFDHEHPAFRQAIDYVGDQPIMMGALHFQNEVGLSTFSIRDRSQSLLDVTMEVFPSKLDYKQDYERLLAEVNEEIYNLAFHFIRKTYVGAQTTIEEQPSQTEFYRILQAHFRSFVQALDRIEQQPHHQLVTKHERMRGDRLQRIDSFGRKFLRQRPHLFAEVSRGIPLAGKSLMPQTGLGRKKRLTFDTDENRFVKMMLKRTLEKIEDLYEQMTLPNHWLAASPDPALVASIVQMKQELRQRLRRPFWQEIGHVDRSVLSLVMQMAPGYRDAFQIYIMLSRGLTLRGSFYRMSVKDVATLYEYWTFLKLGQLLGQKYELVSQNVVQVNRDHLFVRLDGRRAAKRVYRHPHTRETITLHYQYVDRNLPTLPQRPDTMLSIEKKGKSYRYHYIFDAKYRIDFAIEGSGYRNRYRSPGPMEDDINTMHRYRDALVTQHDGPYERLAFGAYVLFPWFEEEMYQQHDFYKSIEKVNIGGLPFLPGATTLVSQFVERLIEKSPEEIQERGILPRGTKESWQSSFDEQVLVGVVRSERHAQAHHRHRFYHIPLAGLKEGWQGAKVVALYYTKKVSTRINGIRFYGRIVRFDIRRREEIQAIRSEHHRRNQLYVVFTIDHWRELEATIPPVGYGIRSHTLTTLRTLQQAKELPELFMKSVAEVTLWRMMRRFSSQVRMKLDHSYLDVAKRILSYELQGRVSLELVLDHERKEVSITSSEGEQRIVPMDQLHRNPAGVFKVLVELMEME